MYIHQKIKKMQTRRPPYADYCAHLVGAKHKMEALKQEKPVQDVLKVEQGWYRCDQGASSYRNSCRRTVLMGLVLWLLTIPRHCYVNGEFFYCGMYLCLRGGCEHRNMKYSQVAFKTVVDPNAPSETIKCLVYTEHGSKNRTGSSHQVHLDNKEVVHYANASLGNRFFVYMVELYMSKLSEKLLKKIYFIANQQKKLKMVFGILTVQLGIIY